MNQAPFANRAFWPHTLWLALTMETTTTQAIKLAIVSATGLSKDALHIYVGLSAQLLTTAILRKPVRSMAPWLVVLALAVAGELVDLRDDMATLGFWRWGTSLHDVLNTIFWPTVLLVFARFSTLFGISK